MHSDRWSISEHPYGPLRAGNVGPYKPITRVPTATAICAGPVSPDMTTLHFFKNAAVSVNDKRPDKSRHLPSSSAFNAAQSSCSSAPPIRTGKCDCHPKICCKRYFQPSYIQALCGRNLPTPGTIPINGCGPNPCSEISLCTTSTS